MISAESVTCLGGESDMTARVWVTLWVLEDTTYPSDSNSFVSDVSAQNKSLEISTINGQTVISARVKS